MKFLLFGGNGILGSGFREALQGNGAQPICLSPPWGSPSEACQYIADRVEQELADASPTTLIWAAGVGQVALDAGSMGVERLALSTMVDAVERSASGWSEPPLIVFASSAGAVFGGHGPTRVSETSVPAPISAYGFEKLEQERICLSLAQRCGTRVLVSRFANVFGLAHGQLRRKGLVEAAVRAVRTGEPMSIYVSPDSRRDYVYNRDAAAASLSLASQLTRGSAVTIIASGTTMSVSSVISLVGAVARRRVPATFADRPYSSLQPKTIRFAGTVTAAMGRASTPMPLAVHRMLKATLEIG